MGELISGSAFSIAPDHANGSHVSVRKNACLNTDASPVTRFVAAAPYIALLAGAGALTLCAANALSEENRSFLAPHSLVISSSTYDRSQGAVASLKAGSTVLANTATATTTAVADNSYVNVWTNEGVDASFGVTSPIRLTDVDPDNGHILRSISVPTDQVVTSFPSKSELGLHIGRDWQGLHLVFVGYAGPGVGALDASNSDSVSP